jgi:hypothetical protein
MFGSVAEEECSRKWLDCLHSMGVLAWYITFVYTPSLMICFQQNRLPVLMLKYQVYAQPSPLPKSSNDMGLTRA